MKAPKFVIVEVKECTARKWLAHWSIHDPSDEGERKHRELIGKHQLFSALDIEDIGRWKDQASSDGRWQANVASVAYLVWKRAACELPMCPKPDEIAAFLTRWSSESYTDNFSTGSVNKRFGLSRATTLLHFVSGGRYPIFDSRVRVAIARLTGARVENTVSWYLETFCPYFVELASHCGTENDLRRLDNALFSFGAAKDL